MNEFTYDAESVDLTDEELAVYGEIVRYTCHLEAQHRLAWWLAGTNRPQPSSVQNFAQRQARFMWRTELRVLRRDPA